MTLQEAYRKRKDKYIADITMRDAILDDLKNQNKALEDARLELALKDVARTLLQKTSDQARETARTVLESTVTTALQHVFGPSFSASIETDIGNGKPIADVYIVTDNGPNAKPTKCKPEEACGGGIVDIVSIALRIAMIQLHQEPHINGPIILDEPGKFVSAEFSVKLAEFLKYISANFNKQIIFVTHNQDLKSVSDVCYVAAIKNGTTEVKQIDPRTGVDMQCTDAQAVEQEKSSMSDV